MRNLLISRNVSPYYFLPISATRATLVTSIVTRATWVELGSESKSAYVAVLKTAYCCIPFLPIRLMTSALIENLCGR
jgi:hypothetical protein